MAAANSKTMKRLGKVKDSTTPPSENLSSVGSLADLLSRAQELQKLHEDPLAFAAVALRDDDDLLVWTAKLNGPVRCLHSLTHFTRSLACSSPPSLYLIGPIRTILVSSLVW